MDDLLRKKFYSSRVQILSGYNVIPFIPERVKTFPVSPEDGTKGPPRYI